MNKSADAYRTISEVAEELDLPQHVLRFWETRFGQIKPLKRAGGRRFYRPDDVDLLKGIRHLLYKEGYTIKGVQRILKEQGVKAIISEIRDTLSERVEPIAFLEPTPPLPPKLESVLLPEHRPTPSSPPHISTHSMEMNSVRRAEPPPLAIPTHINPQVLPHAGVTAVAENMVDHPPSSPPRKKEEQTQANDIFAGDLFADLPLPLSPPPDTQRLAANTKVSMFRGGITMADKVEPSLQEVVPSTVLPPAPPVIMPALAESPEVSLPQLDNRKTENRAILTFALQELATCRAMIEDLRYTQQAAE